jgi:hypothetical protein
MIREYTHSELNQEVYTISGYYIPQKEVKLKYNNREVLYVVGLGVIDSSCCGVGGCSYALVPGYVVNWRNKTNGDSLPISDVEMIRDEETRQDITRIIKANENITQIDFW